MPLIQLRLVIKYAISLIFILFISFMVNKASAEEVENNETATPSKVFDLFEEAEDLGESEDLTESSERVNSEETLNVLATSENDERSTSEKLEDLKQEVIAVNRDLFILEEDLLFPASTQVALYLSVDIGYFFALDNLKLKLDDKQVTHHLYTEKDVDALYRGAIQKAYIGNINSGEHQLVAIIVGTGPHNRAYRKAVSFTFEKGTGAKAIEIQLRDDSGKLQPTLNIVEW